MKPSFRLVFLLICLGCSHLQAAEPSKSEKPREAFTLLFEQPISVQDILAQVNAKLPGLPHQLNIPPVIEAELYGAINAAIGEDMVGRQERRQGERTRDLDVETVECQRYVPLETVISTGMIPAGTIHVQVDEYFAHACPDSPLAKLKDRRAYNFSISFHLIVDLKAYQRGQQFVPSLEETENALPRIWVRNHLYVVPAKAPAEEPKKP